MSKKKVFKAGDLNDVRNVIEALVKRVEALEKKKK